ncbi:MAG: hypothetical protein JF607_23950 [Burkholderiales bacterium]|jgi:DNA-binding CsgD family transcriptional regulator|nr:hypothetical protein [Burkholderiales bacterium]
MRTLLSHPRFATRNSAELPAATKFPSESGDAWCAHLIGLPASELGNADPHLQGSSDFLEKPSSDQDLPDAIGHALDAAALHRAESAKSTVVSSRFATLTARERQIKGLVAAGRLNKQIAGDPDIAEPTVKMHRGAAMRKMGARTAAELVLMGQHLGLVG